MVRPGLIAIGLSRKPRQPSSSSPRLDWGNDRDGDGASFGPVWAFYGSVEPAQEWQTDEALLDGSAPVVRIRQFMAPLKKPRRPF